MAFLHVKNVKIVGVSAGVPRNIVSNRTLSSERGEISGNYTPEDFIRQTGVCERRFSKVLCSSDLCFAAAEKLIKDIQWEKSEIDALIFVSQTADYTLPATACILQDKLGLSKECYAADITLGCTGWVYGLSVIAALVSSGSIRKALLLTGEAKRCAPEVPNPLFGFAGAATAVEYENGADGLRFHFGTDGSGYEAIIQPDSGARNQIRPESFELEEFEGMKMHRIQTHMKGMDVFSFGITTAPKSIKLLAEHYSLNYHDYDYYLLHQANMKMNNMIVKKLRIDPLKVPSEMCNFGNTSSASIPLLMVTQIRDQIDLVKKKFICCGFGVGLSWGTVAFDQKMSISELIEVDDSEANYGYKV